VDGGTVSPSEALPATAIAGNERRVPVWDPFVRLAHWSLATAVIAAYFVTQDAWIHENAGYLALGLVALRLVWGFLGSQYARFAQFLRSPAEAIAYLRDLPRGRSRRHLGHNPAGGWSIIAMLFVVALVALSGILMNTDRFWGNALVEDIHTLSADVMMGLVVIHLCGVLASSLAHKENLVIAMITGRKRDLEAAETVKPRRPAGRAN
jgi:cytochrome b